MYGTRDNHILLYNDLGARFIRSTKIDVNIINIVYLIDITSNANSVPNLFKSLFCQKNVRQE